MIAMRPQYITPKFLTLLLKTIILHKNYEHSKTTPNAKFYTYTYSPFPKYWNPISISEAWDRIGFYFLKSNGGCTRLVQGLLIAQMLAGQGIKQQSFGFDDRCASDEHASLLAL